MMAPSIGILLEEELKRFLVYALCDGDHLHFSLASRESVDSLHVDIIGHLIHFSGHVPNFLIVQAFSEYFVMDYHINHQTSIRC
jgi:hypothetical protein